MRLTALVAVVCLEGPDRDCLVAIVIVACAAAAIIWLNGFARGYRAGYIDASGEEPPPPTWEDEHS